MIDPPVPADESARVAALAACNILDTPPEESFDDLAGVAAQICGAPVALVSLVDADRQWFKAGVNFEVAETPRRISFCAHAIATDRELVVPDTLADERFKDNPLVVSRPRFRFYCGRSAPRRRRLADRNPVRARRRPACARSRTAHRVALARETDFA